MVWWYISNLTLQHKLILLLGLLADRKSSRRQPVLAGDALAEELQILIH
jgi:hypothetical protein